VLRKIQFGQYSLLLIRVCFIPMVAAMGKSPLLFASEGGPVWVRIDDSQIGGIFCKVEIGVSKISTIPRKKLA